MEKLASPNTTISLSSKASPCKPLPGIFHKNYFTPQSFSTNHFTMKFNKNQIVYQYSLSLTPAPSKDARRLYRQAIEVADLGRYFKDFYQQGQTLFSLQKIETLKLQANIPESKNQDELKMQLDISLIKEVPLADIDKYDGTGNSITQIFNFYIKDKMQALDYIELGQNSKYFDPYEQFKASELLGIIKGFSVTSKVCFNQEMQLTVNPIAKVIRTETALEYINSLKKFLRNKFKSQLINECVMQTFGNHKLLRISGVETKMNPLTKIPGEKNGEIVYMVPELVQMSGLTDRMRNNMAIMKQVAEFTRVDPSSKIKSINNLVSEIRSLKDQEGIEIDGKSVEGTGFIMEKPIIRILGGKEIQPNQSGVFQAKEIKANSGVVLKNWMFIHIKDDRDTADKILELMKKAGQSFGFTIEKPGFIEIQADKRPFDYKVWEKEIMMDVNKYGNPQFVFSLMKKKGNEATKLYNQLKQLFQNQLGCIHQNCLTDSFRNEQNALSIATKLVTQIFAKLGEKIWVTQIPKGIPENTMLIGIDVYHKTLQNKNSVAAFISTIDNAFSSYYNQTDIHPKGQELLPNFGQMFEQSLTQYQKKNGKFPDCVIIYRDGVGNGQIDLVLNFELNQMKNILKELNIDPQVSVILVNKRINDKFFTLKGQNPQSGSVVCENIVAQNIFEFFLTAQYVTQGTATPTKYSLIYNNSSITQDELILLTYWQCFNYFNWQGAVRVPSVAMYAHKLAYQVGENMECDILMKDKLAYL